MRVITLTNTSSKGLSHTSPAAIWMTCGVKASPAELFIHSPGKKQFTLCNDNLYRIENNIKNLQHI